MKTCIFHKKTYKAVYKFYSYRPHLYMTQISINRRRENKSRYIHSMEYHSATKKELLADAATWMNLKIILLKEARHKNRIHCMIAFIWNSKTDKPTCNESHTGLNGGSLWQSDWPERGERTFWGWQKWFIGLNGNIRYTGIWVSVKTHDLCISLHVKRKKLTGSSVWAGLCQLVGFTAGSCLGGNLHWKVPNGHSQWIIFLAWEV